MMEEFIGYLLIKANMQVKQAVRQKFFDAGFPVTPEQWAILHILSADDGQNQRQLAESLSKQKPNITRLVDILEDGGYVRRENNKDDRRFFNVFITDEGRKLSKEIYEHSKTLKDELYQNMTEEEIETLKKLLLKVIEQ